VSSIAPLLTIVTINKDNAAGLERTLTSLASLRDNPLVQFVFVDGNSADRSVDTARTFYRDTEVSIGRDDGIYDAMNKGLHRSNGIYIVFINSGDEVIPKAMPRLLGVLSGACKDMVLFSAFLVDGIANQPLELIQPSPDRIPLYSHVHSSIVYRRECLSALSGYINCFPVVADRESMLAFHFAGATFGFESFEISTFYVGGISSQWPAEIEHDQLSYDYKLIGLKNVYVRCRRWLGVPQSMWRTLIIALFSPLRRRRINARISNLKTFLHS
jgi:glycosyltransferase involved in cell wall biosynthesis